MENFTIRYTGQLWDLLQHQFQPLFLWYITKNSGTPISYYRRYINDIFSVCNNSFEAKEFFNYINTRHPNIKFTVEPEVNKIIPFPDVLTGNSQDILKTWTYHKSIYSGFRLNNISFTSRFYKIRLKKYLTDRAYKINNTWPGFHDDVSKIKNILKRNSYPPFI